MTTDTAAHSVGQLTIVPRDDITIVRIDRPEKLNALATAFWGDLQTVLEQLEHDRRTRVIILTGTGDKAFCVGGDINDFAKLATLAQKRAFQADAMRGFAGLENCPLPVIAAVNGLALGGGCELTLASDIVIASEHAQFGMPEAALGLVPGYGVLRGPDVIGRQLTKLMVMAGERLTASQALAAGLVQQVVNHAALLDAALALAARIAANSSLAHRMGKQLINRNIDRAEFDYSVEALTVLQGSDDAREGIAAFLEKRRPRFSLPSNRGRSG